MIKYKVLEGVLMKNKVKKIILWVVLAVVLLPVLAFAVTEFWYLPHYWANKRVLDFGEANESEIRVMSANVRCWAPDDLGKRSWFFRADLIAQNIEKTSPDIIGFQEVTWLHYGYLTDIMPEFDSVIEYRDDFVLSEGCPIFYSRDKFDLVDKGSFWLSETPEKMSKDWGSACYRICSYIILKEKTSGKELIVFNTHLDHVSDEARIKGIEVVLDKQAEFGGMPMLLMGDLNAAPGSVTYNSAAENFWDACKIADDSIDGATYQNWGAKLDNPRIDYIMVSKTGISVKTYKVLTDTYDGIYPSDHFPIYADIVLTE